MNDQTSNDDTVNSTATTFEQDHIVRSDCLCVVLRDTIRYDTALVASPRWS